MIKALVFDMGGVILKLDGEKCIRAFKEIAGFADIEDYLDLYHQKGYFSDLEEGKIGPDDFFRESLKHCAPGTDAETVRACFDSLLASVDPSAVALLKSCMGRYRMFVLSNNNPISRAKFSRLLEAEGIPMEDVFERTFFSYELHLLKPGREIYQKVVDEIGVRPDEILFIDDAAANIEGAESVGIRTLLHVPDADLKAEVEECLSRIS